MFVALCFRYSSARHVNNVVYSYRSNDGVADKEEHDGQSENTCLHIFGGRNFN